LLFDLRHVVAVGTPEQISAAPESYTGQYLKQVLERRRKAKRAAAATEAGSEAWCDTFGF
jgi:excinuclease ABC subunit A